MLEHVSYCAFLSKFVYYSIMYHIITNYIDFSYLVLNIINFYHSSYQVQKYFYKAQFLLKGSLEKFIILRIIFIFTILLCSQEVSTKIILFDVLFNLFTVINILNSNEQLIYFKISFLKRSKIRKKFKSITFNLNDLFISI